MCYVEESVQVVFCASELQTIDSQCLRKDTGACWSSWWLGVTSEALLWTNIMAASVQMGFGCWCNS